MTNTTPTEPIVDKTAFDRFHDAGAERHPRAWFVANLKAMHAARGQGLDPSRDKAAISAIVLAVLDAVQPTSSPAVEGQDTAELQRLEAAKGRCREMEQKPNLAAYRNDISYFALQFQFAINVICQLQSTLATTQRELEQARQERDGQRDEKLRMLRLYQESNEKFCIAWSKYIKAGQELSTLRAQLPKLVEMVADKQRVIHYLRDGNAENLDTPEQRTSAREWADSVIAEWEATCAASPLPAAREEAITNSLQREVAEWADPIFGTDLKGPLLHMWEELCEAFDEQATEKGREEIADAGLCHKHICALCGVNLPEAPANFKAAIEAKFAICRSRTWGEPDEDGVVRHVEAAREEVETPKDERTEHVPNCHAQRDGDCDWKHCPQLHDGEPAKSGRACPLMHWTESEEW